MRAVADTYSSLAGTVISAFESGVRASTNLQRRVATAVPEPAKSLVSITADWTRDLGAAVASIARWTADA
jgi:hypothetical protein